MITYVDTSVLIAIEFQEPDGLAMVDRWNAAEQKASAPLMEAEYLSACRREGRPPSFERLASVAWIVADRALRQELAAVLSAGYVRAADCWHLATALWLAPEPSELTFFTLDSRQRQVAERLGFRT